jgi:hypothetical protein
LTYSLLRLQLNSGSCSLAFQWSGATDVQHIIILLGSVVLSKNSLLIKLEFFNTLQNVIQSSVEREYIIVVAICPQSHYTLKNTFPNYMTYNVHVL